MISLEQFNRLKKEVEEADREKERSQGALDQLKKELQEKFGCKSFEEARRLLAKKREKLLKEKVQFDKDVETFREDFREQEY